MSYICLLAGERGIAAAGDSRLTVSPVPLHWDRAKKVFCAPEQQRIWACCGLTMFGGVNYAALTGRILSGKGALDEQLQTICRRVNPALNVQRKLYRQANFFSLLLGQITREGIDLVTLDLDGKSVNLRHWNAPAILEAGWRAELRPPMPDPNQFRQESPQELANRARERVAWAIAKDHRLSKTEKRHTQTVGGSITWVILELPEEIK